ncbi:bacillithiol biosynthesis deacetylase BshB2 [Oceanobacillus neutriphilus]|uniref:N-acetyl-alpha-D-glucosaminyl L-malate deacetylase 2 n=1 Tax=Oceanobacillus neutriphilus TaxID=531815 RepID=A0ABQ2NM59_9BACI|nr:bacillithiol biosynthesis deacetylase BshB2 [Oceanobacillus neutriphilus]GGP06908.1 putative N-acetyl-alpha-D-glucosaminyl L-malate deacetylase 2 [Oceanobacillus neutriphilus]
MEKHVVVIFPHPDDEAFGAAGSVAKFRAEGVPVTYLCGTLGQMGRNMGNPTFANRESLPEIRKKELKRACETLDMELKMLGYRDKTIEFEDKQEVADHLRGYLEEIKPSLVITHYPGYAVHPDHNSLGAAAIQAVEDMNREERPKVWAQAFSNNHLEDLGNPDITNNVIDYFDKKLQTILSHDSQVAGMFGWYKQLDDLDEEVKKELIENQATERFYVWDFEKDSSK